MQEPTTAKYDGMPISAVQAGYTTHILPVDRDAGPVGRPPPSGGSSACQMSTYPDKRHKPHFALLRSATGHDFSCYKKNTIGRRDQRAHGAARHRRRRRLRR
ncbi:MAG: hypothetical protein U5J62_04755 [Desulfurivibrio sp.]|nr:hypothetical protein [Desulfurivibrio sp.]